MAFKEKDMQVLFGHWIRLNFKNSAAFELKLSHSDSLPFSALQEHQKNALRVVKHGKAFFKIPDTGYQCPFDSFVLVEAEAYVVVAFYKQRTKKICYLIDIDAWIEAEKTSSRKSITITQAMMIATAVAVL